jgi:hypothetical protein
MQGLKNWPPSGPCILQWYIQHTTPTSRISLLKQGISTVFINQMRTSCFQKNTFYAGIKIFNSLPPSVTILKNDKAKFKAALRKYLNTHSFYTKNCVYLCIFYLLHFLVTLTHMDPWNVCITRHLWSNCKVILLPTIQREIMDQKQC